ncbi:hypothetical protein DRQ50_01805 [bacterium]|nr:MAG: hypothetical protein DRQ50_01805 [bacterium]
MVNRIAAAVPARLRALAGAGLGAGLGILILLAGCGLHNPYPVGSFERGAYYAEHGNNLEAIPALESFVRHNPTDSLAPEAQYLKGMTYMATAEFPLAAVEFQILRKDYPVSDRVEDALFMEGEAYLSQVGHVSRDMTGAHQARLHFVRFMEEYPSSSHLPAVEERLQEISDMMVRKRLGQVKVYRQLGRHQAAALALDDILRFEAGSNLIDDVIWERARTAGKLEDEATAGDMYQRLINEYPDSRHTESARKALMDLRDKQEQEA